MIYVIKRDNTAVEFDGQKIKIAIDKANNELSSPLSVEKIATLYIEVLRKIENHAKEHNRILVEEIQDIVEETMVNNKYYKLAKTYIVYRFKRELLRKQNTTDKTIKELVEGNSEYWNTENSNKKACLVTTQRDYIAGITSTDIARRFLFPEHVVEAHDAGIIHIHDMDYAAQNALHNCDLVNLDDMLQNGTCINGVHIDKPHRFLTAMTLAAQIITAVSSSQYGGVSITLTHLAPFVRSSYERYLKLYQDRGMSEELVLKYAKEDLAREINAGCQTFQYQVNSMATTNGQAPFISVGMYIGETEEYQDELALIIEEMLNQRILGMKNDVGVYVSPAFPKLLYFLDENNATPGTKYYYLTELAAKCSVKRLTPDYISVKIMKENKINKLGKGDAYPCMGCRSFLTADRIEGNPAKAKNYNPNEGKYYGRFNQGVVTISLPDLALSSGGDIKKFWDLFDERTELCHEALQVRNKRLAAVTSDVAPILWQDGALARLDKHESIKPLLYGGYSTISLGYAGLYECVKFMTGHSHTDGGIGEKFGLEVMQRLNDKCNVWKKAEDIDYSLYGTPIESTTYKFAKGLKKRFGKDVFVGIDGKDRDYITNSYHVPVFEEIDAFSKLALEAKFQKLSPGGAVSYVETPNLQNNLDAALQIINFIYNNIMYAELNTKSDYCQVCGFDGEMQIDEKMDWYCPNCGNRDHDKLNIARRTCGYIGTNFWNKGRTQEIKERVLHIDNKDANE